MTNTEHGSHQDGHNLIEATQDAAKETAAFSILYHAADAQWVGGALLGNHVVEKYNANPWLMAIIVACGVGYTEYKLSNVAVNTFERKEDLDANPGKIRKGISEIGATAYVSLCGSANGVKINDSLGLESTERRRKIQAGIFGTAVSLWVTPLPYFDDGAELAKNTVSDMFDNPINFVVYSSVSIAGILGISKIAKETRKAYNRYKTRKLDRAA